MNLQRRELPYRQLGRFADKKSSNELRRFFGRDVTNFDQKNSSICEKLPALQNQRKSRSFSLCGKYKSSSPQKEAILHYKEDIVNFMVESQSLQPASIQKQVTQKMRLILVDWLVSVHDSFQLKQQTLHLALSYLSEFSSLCQISKDEYQLVGITCLWIASKYEQIYPPRAKNYVEITADTYSMRDLIEMQGKIILALNFNLNHITSLNLLSAFGEQLSQQAACLCKYLLELGLSVGLKYRLDIMVISSISLADEVLKQKTEIRHRPIISSLQKQQISGCFKEMCILLEGGDHKSETGALRQKFRQDKYFKVSKIKTGIAL